MAVFWVTATVGTLEAAAALIVVAPFRLALFVAGEILVAAGWTRPTRRLRVIVRDAEAESAERLATIRAQVTASAPGVTPSFGSAAVGSSGWLRSGSLPPGSLPPGSIELERRPVVTGWPAPAGGSIWSMPSPSPAYWLDPGRPVSGQSIPPQPIQSRPIRSRPIRSRSTRHLRRSASAGLLAVIAAVVVGYALLFGALITTGAARLSSRHAVTTGSSEPYPG